MTPATMPPPSAFQRPARQERKAQPSIPFMLIFQAFSEAERPAVQAAIDALVLARRSPSVPRVREYLHTALIVTTRLAPHAMPDDCDITHLSRVAEQCEPKHDMLTERLARCVGRPALSAEDEARYQAITTMWEPWGYLPSMNRYDWECSP